MAVRTEPRETRLEHDITARARIREAAMDEFGAHGFAGATMRGIAAAAGVSVGLVQHHFGTKDGLRAACDEAVLEVVERKTAAVAASQLGDNRLIASLLSSAPRLQRYVARAIVDGSPNIDRLVDQLVESYEDYLLASWPDRFKPGEQRTRAAGAVGTAIGLSTIVMERHLARTLGVEPWTQAAVMQAAAGMLDVIETFAELTRSDTWQKLREGIADSAPTREGNEHE